MMIVGESFREEDLFEDDEIIDDDLIDDESDGAAAPGPVASHRRPSARRWVLFAGLAIGVLVLDQLTKAWVTGNLGIGDAVEVLDGWLRIVHWRNSGMLFGLLPQTAGAFAIVTPVVAGLIVAYHWKAGRGLVTTVALGLLLGGAIGNLVDRLRHGSVVDFVDMGIGEWRFYTYNIADAGISTAIVLLLLLAVFPRLADWAAE